MIISNFGNNFNYELEKLTRLFLPFERIDVVNYLVNEDRFAVTKTEFTANGCNLSAELFNFGKHYSSNRFIKNSGERFQKECQLGLANCLFDCLIKHFDYKPEWGILTGVRPTRLYLQTLNLIKEKTNDYFSNVLRVSDNKISLLSKTAKSEESIISLSKTNSFSLYISIPFCPTRCSYCSFVSHSVEKANDIIPTYLEYLIKELDITAEIVKNLKLNLETIYIGGGTPTTLTDKQLDLIISFVEEKFDLSNLREFTVEAGRPDTITKEKLLVLKKHNITRISINPQTLNDSVLEVVGRKHTSKQFFDSFNLAREIGFDNINTDLIAGLPTDTFESFSDTINKIIKLSPEGVTVHSLSLKRSSSLTKEGFEPLIKEGELAKKMVNFARDELQNNRIFPYYMYRQSKTVGNLENVGYAKQSFEGLYNVYIMDETHTILACGASATTKLKDPYSDKKHRIFNFKYPYEYIGRFNEQIERKKEIVDFYNSCKSF